MMRLGYGNAVVEKTKDLTVKRQENLLRLLRLLL